VLKEISKSEEYFINSEKIQVNPNQKYKVEVKVVGFSGSNFSAHLAVVCLDENGRDNKRFIRWFNDFSGNQTLIKMVFSTLEYTTNIIIGYRFNLANPVKSDLKVDLPDIFELKIEKTDSEDELFDNEDEFQVPVLPSLTKQEEDNLEKNIIWIYGSPRSGTTWLALRLLNHPKNVIWNEPLIGFHLGALVGKKDFEKGYSFARASDNEGGRGDYFFCKTQHVNNWLPELRTLLLKRTYSQAQTTSKNIVIKEPTGSNGANLIMRCLPKSKFLFLIRDGRDIVESRLDMHGNKSWAKLPPLNTKESRIEMIQFYSELWKTFTLNTRRAFTNHDQKLRHLVKYENLRTQTFDELKIIYKFLRIPISDDALKRIIQTHDFNNIPKRRKGAGKFNRKAKPGGWKEVFSDEEKNIMNSIMGPLLSQFGYDV